MFLPHPSVPQNVQHSVFVFCYILQIIQSPKMNPLIWKILQDVITLQRIALTDVKYEEKRWQANIQSAPTRSQAKLWTSLSASFSVTTGSSCSDPHLTNDTEAERQLPEHRF